ncbi:hypothetical protein [Ideonella sp.]|uniref:hypothetical protein n=1 Tax=Ideonella sp. TaxID=1929293 RepID=UPI0035B07CD3
MTRNEVSGGDLEYRKLLVEAERKGQEEFDKTVLSLSGGALGVSFVFLKDVIGNQPLDLPGLLIAAWVSWGFSTLAVLLSYHLSIHTIRRCIEQIDRCQRDESFGGVYAEWTKRLNVAGAVLFFVGVISITVFAAFNFSNKGAPNARTSTVKPAVSASAAAPVSNSKP